MPPKPKLHHMMPEMLHEIFDFLSAEDKRQLMRQSIEEENIDDMGDAEELLLLLVFSDLDMLLI